MIITSETIIKKVTQSCLLTTIVGLHDLSKVTNILRYIKQF